VLEQVLAEGGAEAGREAEPHLAGLSGAGAALAECKAVEAACELGLARTEEQTASGSGQLALYRLKVLELRDRVRTYKALAFPSSSSSGFASSAASSAPSTGAVVGGWAAYRRRPVREIAEDLASEGNVRGLSQVSR
jgi:hypothetical protein